MSSDDPYCVELLNVPDYKQGGLDRLCTYYTGAMMLATLFPALAAFFGEPKGERTTKRMSLDPIIRHYSNEDHRLVLARWFYFGEWIKKLVAILNAIVDGMEGPARDTEFEYLRGNPGSDRTFHRIVESVNEGLPVMLGWDAEDYGCHAVLVTGYRRGKEDWLITNDPGGGDEINWNSLKMQQGRRFEVGLCADHAGLRPMKRITAVQGETPTVHQWRTKTREYKVLQ